MEFIKVNKCVKCGSGRVYYVAFTRGKAISVPLNEGDKEMTTDYLPPILTGHYCANCKSFCSVEPKDEAVREDKIKEKTVERADNKSELTNNAIATTSTPTIRKRDDYDR